jgi:hypothetical protein
LPSVDCFQIMVVGVVNQVQRAGGGRLGGNKFGDASQSINGPVSLGQVFIS